MFKPCFLFALLLSALTSFAQTFSWSAYPAGSIDTSYTNGAITAVIAKTNTTMGYTTPQYRTGTTVGRGQCGMANSLSLEANTFGNITKANVLVSIDFTSGGTTNGICSKVAFQIFDINADESTQTFFGLRSVANNCCHTQLDAFFLGTHEYKNTI